MKTKFIAWMFVVIALGCKKESPPPTLMKGSLDVYRQYFTKFSDGVKEEKRYEHAQAKFIYNNTYAKEAGRVAYGDSVLQPNTFFHYFTYNTDEVVPRFSPGLEGGRLWSVSGNAQNDVPAFSTTAPLLPSFLSLTFDTLPVLHKSRPFTVSWDNSTPCDSISIHLSQSHTYVASGTIAGNISSYTFTPAQLSVFQNSYSPYTDVYLVMEGWTYKHITVSDMPVTLENYARRNCNIRVAD